MRPGLALLLVLAACGTEDPGPVSRVAAMPSGAGEELVVYEELPAGDVTLLFLAGRAATPAPDGGSAWADLEGGRVIRFDADGGVEAVLAGAPEGGAPLTQPAFVAFEGGDVLAVELDGRALRFRGGRPLRWEAAPAGTGWTGGADGARASSRTLFDIDLAPLAPTDPLAWLEQGGSVTPLGRVSIPPQAMLAPVANAGWAAPTPGGGVYFAWALRPEIIRFRRDGSVAWTAVWNRPGVEEPRFGITSGTLTPVFRVIQQAMTVGPDGRVYVLATTGEQGPADRLLVIDGDGTLLREGRVGPYDAVYVDPRGHVYRAPRASALARSSEAGRTARFASFDLPVLGGAGRVRLEEHRGHVVVVNFWASWCIPCRKEMPLLADLARRRAADGVVVLGLNEDVTSSAGLDFLAELGGVPYPVAEGGGRLKETYGYRGLPYTVVLDRDGRLVKALYGFGASIGPIEDAVEEALAGP